jgi:hypothetical protein
MTPPAPLIPVDSAWIASETYASDATLTVHFRRGTVYRYFTVPSTIVEAFLTAPSKAAFQPSHSERLPLQTGQPSAGLLTLR